MSPAFKRYLIGIVVGLLTLIGLLVTAEIAPLAGLLVLPALLFLLLWAEGWTWYGLAVIAGVVVVAFVAQRGAG